jgi:hypothetical protein
VILRIIINVSPLNLNVFLLATVCLLSHNVLQDLKLLKVEIVRFLYLLNEILMKAMVSLPIEDIDLTTPLKRNVRKLWNEVLKEAGES